MAEVLFILVTLYGAYVIHSVITCNQKKSKEKAVPSSIVDLKNPSKIVKKEATPIATKPSKPRKTPQKKAVSKQTKAKLPKGSVRNPESGEITKIATSYRMTKRWIKEALVTEGLLDKVYKVSEIDTAATKKIDKALEKLQSMDKYQ